MTHPIAIAPARPVRRSLTSVAVAAALCLVAGAAVSQTPPPAQRPAAPAAKPAPKPAAPAQKPAAQPAPAPAAPAAPAQQAQAPEMPPLVYSPWAKFCGKGQEADAKQVCFTGKDAHSEQGMPIVAAALIEPDGAPKKIFRVTLPLGLQLQQGTRILVDQEQVAAGPFLVCFPNGCLADFEATPDLIGKLKKGQMLMVQALNLPGNFITLPMPLTDFAKANEGPPVDPKVFEAQQKKLQEELQKRADEARKRLEQQQGGQAAAPAAPK